MESRGPAAPALIGALLYQPRFDCRTGELVGTKLYLGRPQGPHNLVLDSGDATGLTALHTACAQLVAWSQAGRGPLALTVGAELDVLGTTAFAHALNDILLTSRLPPQCLELNIITTRSEVSDDALAALRQLKNYGIHLAISTASPASARLAWLGHLPMDTLEVPSRLVQDVITSPEGVAIARALVTHAHKLKLSICAKGIDNPHTAAVMVATGCDFVQGPLFGDAQPAEQFAALLAANRRLDSALLRGPRPERTLLLVDDEDNILSSLRRLLRRDAYTILTATSGGQGLELLAANPVDVIISDQRMPGMTGVEFLRKAKDMCPDSVRMVLSGYTDLQSVTDAINEGAIYKFLTKPWDDAMLRANIEEAFRRKLLSDENRRLGEALKHANEELERINARLTNVLADRERRLGMEEAALNLTHEALAVMPLPLLGIDPGGMIALANGAAERLFAARAPLIGLDAGEVLPAGCLPLVHAGHQRADVDCAGRRFRVEAHPLRGTEGARGTLLSFTCRSDTE